MSLAASGGGAGLGAGGGMAMSAGIAAHGGPSAMATHAAAHAHHQGGASHAGPAPGVAPPGSFAALAADVVDRGQNLTLRGVRGVAGLPVVAIDLYGDGGEVAAFPPVAGEDEDTGNASGKKQKSAKAAAAKAAAKAKAAAEEEPRSIKAIGSISVNRTDVVLKKDDDATHKAVRRLLTKGFGYETVMKAALMEDEKATNDAAKAARIVKPHLLLGVRRTAELDPATLALYTVADADGAAIAEVSDAARSNAVTIRNGTLDGSARPNGDDFDRVAFHLAIHGKKKGLTMLPDEAVGIVVAQAKRLAYKDYAEDIADADDDADSEEAYLEVPTAVAVPGWNCSDATSEALIEACGGSNVALYQRPVAAAVGSLLPRSDTGAPSKLLQHVGEKLNAVNKERQMRARTAEARGEEPDGPTEAFHPVLVYAGATAEGLEMTAVQLSKIQDMDEVDGMAPFGDFKVITSVAYRTNDPMSKVKQALNVLTANIDEMMPELFDDDGGPVSFVTYGSISTQLKMREALTKALAASSDEDWSSGKIPFQSTKEECVACGVALLAAVSHGRLTTVVSETRKDGKQRAKGKPAVVVQNSSCSAVGVRYNYFGGSEKKWSAVKTVFDFDRRVPAGPYSIEFSAAECAAIRANGGKDMEEEELLEASKTLGGAKNIPAREEAALALRVQVVQQLERDGTWIKVGDVMKPLTMTKKNDDDDEDDDDAKAKAEPFACEESILELSLNPVGMLTNAFISDGQSVVQATKSARNSAIRYYVGIAAAILFFGGFMVKSYMEEKIFERDVQRVLAFYKHAAPGSISDGDDRNARWLVYKYKGRKDKLWRRLEVKYDMEVKQAWEWDDDDQVQKEDGETEDLDRNSDEPKGDEQGEDKQDDEPDL